MWVETVHLGLSGLNFYTELCAWKYKSVWSLLHLFLIFLVLIILYAHEIKYYNGFF